MYPNKQHLYVLYFALTFMTISKFSAHLSSQINSVSTLYTVNIPVTEILICWLPVVIQLKASQQQEIQSQKAPSSMMFLKTNFRPISCIFNGREQLTNT
jgi:hypothetical protein